MNQNVKSLFVAGAVLATALSCTKNESDPANPITCKLVSMRLIHPNDVEQRVKTDLNGNFVGIANYVNGQLYGSNTLTYSNGKAVVTDSTAARGDAPAKQEGISTYTLGGDGNAVSRYYTGSPYERADSVYYTYDAGGYIIRKVEKLFKPSTNGERIVEHTVTQTYTYVNGVCTQEDVVSAGVDGDYHAISKYEYYETPAGINYQIPNMATRLVDYPFLGKHGAALLKKVTYFDADKNKETGAYNYTYDYDGSGKPVKAYFKPLAEGTGLEATVTLGYDCD